MWRDRISERHGCILWQNLGPSSWNSTFESNWSIKYQGHWPNFILTLRLKPFLYKLCWQNFSALKQDFLKKGHFLFPPSHLLKPHIILDIGHCSKHTMAVSSYSKPLVSMYKTGFCFKFEALGEGPLQERTGTEQRARTNTLNGRSGGTGTTQMRTIAVPELGRSAEVGFYVPIAPIVTTEQHVRGISQWNRAGSMYFWYNQNGAAGQDKEEIFAPFYTLDD